jgi:hypothetical protein
MLATEVTPRAIGQRGLVSQRVERQTGGAGRDQAGAAPDPPLEIEHEHPERARLTNAAPRSTRSGR